ncbi:hypothetical protein [Streptomyces sp. NRRL S-146]|uniref:Rv1733c family protein n=1 Tax=Streptomyces sp. NRRL S-146 TaxID=1463884 RepID=UPI0004C5A6E3|nr:hypothetical protein [Streptomyces sp. NRRL S-146]
MALRGPRVWLWRWRRNPLKRRADRVEAWVVLGVWLLTGVVGVLAGTAVSSSVEDGLARERAEWRPLVARLAERAPGTASENAHASRAEHVWATARWTAADGSEHSGQLRVPAGSATGAVVPLGAGRGLRSRLERRRIDQWDAEWSRFGPMWRRMAG